MCFAFQIDANFQQVTEFFELQTKPVQEYQRDLFANKPALTIMPHRVPEVLAWGFQHPTLNKRVINARSETVAKNPLFKSAFSRHRCLIPATGFLEWGADKCKYLIRLEDPLFAFAGIYRTGEVTMLTCSPNEFMSTIHDRMPVILPRSSYDRWLDEGGEEMLQPYAGPMRSLRISEPQVKPEKKERQGELFD